ncbi:AT-rich interactive domain-containing protein 6 [Alnus glutinosa]|uniref:AT-rich interactive domain-containing protein 6 n=1 Tax=Alnus glutinosa TaxID=3517 RepID=UPI002D768F98|nr:AT-rich interactive domain-containing protein 6 [Alnus glutinosa]XP_062163923.1 AT-rich interactive domain-containing protein 6 [Alnus glutinosa]
MEGDKETLEQDSPKGSDIDLVDASVQRQEHPTTISKEDDQNQNPSSENGKSGTNEEDKSLVSPAEDQVMLDAHDDKAAVDDGKIDGAADVKVNEKPLESKSNGTDGRIEIHLEAPTTLDAVGYSTPVAQNKNVWLSDVEMSEADEWGTPQEQAAFMKELERFHREKALEFKPPKFYGEPLNCLKLWRAVIRLGGYELVTSSKLWRQVGESFHPPKTCTTVSWTFRIFYEKALLEYEKHKRETGELQLPGSVPVSTRVEKEGSGYQAPGSGRARRDAAARAMQGWHSQRLLGYGEVAEPIIKDKNLNSAQKREKNLRSIGLLKHKSPTSLEHGEKAAIIEADKQLVTTVVDVGPPADWVKINVRETKDCFEVYALVPGLLREEVRVQSDPAGRLVITGQPEQLDNPWGITPFKKVVSLPARIDPLQTSAVVSLHGRLFVRVPFE